ncbi:MAG: 2-oxo acid dehydrogenase subunit E2, partial [Acidobacteria bacterium]|nr:2-oxo acid dehydrogenase subunit E2 [Acidobacteriota bacterium]
MPKIVQELTLPNLGDGVASGDVLKVLVKVGDTIKKDQAVVELETDKATVEVPSTAAGLIKEVRVKAGDKVQPGQVVLVLDEGGEAAKAPEAPAAKKAPEPSAARSAAPPPAKEPEPSSEVRAEIDADQGRDTPAAPADETTQTAAEPAPAESTSTAAASADDDRPRASVVDINQGRPMSAGMASSAAGPTGVVAPAAPSVRRLAREIGVDINVVTGTGSGGRISQDDVKEFSKRVLSSLGSSGQVAMAGAAAPNARPGLPSIPLPDFAKWGEVERKPMSGIRRKTAEHLSHAWTAIPHVTQFDKADITTLEQMRKKYRDEVQKVGGNLTVTAIATKVVAAALKAFPQFNASVDMAGQAIVYKSYIS